MPTPKRGYFTRNGTKVPGVTTILGRFKESGALIHWAWSQGKAGKDFREERDAAASAGTLAHALVGLHLQGVSDSDVREKTPATILEPALVALNNFLQWEKQNRYTVSLLEEPMVSEEYAFGGTPDLMLELDGIRSIADIKTGGLYVEALCQLAAYRMLWNENHPDKPVVGPFILLRFDREHGDFSYHQFGELDGAWQMFRRLRECYDLDRLLGGRLKG